VDRLKRVSQIYRASSVQSKHTAGRTLVQPERVGWIIFVFDLKKSLVFPGAIRGFDSLGTFIYFLTKVVHLDAT
jgi:hypothetical protein